MHLSHLLANDSTDTFHFRSHHSTDTFHFRSCNKKKSRSCRNSKSWHDSSKSAPYSLPIILNSCSNSPTISSRIADDGNLEKTVWRWDKPYFQFIYKSLMAFVKIPLNPLHKYFSYIILIFPIYLSFLICFSTGIFIFLAHCFTLINWVTHHHVPISVKENFGRIQTIIRFLKFWGGGD